MTLIPEVCAWSKSSRSAALAQQYSNWSEAERLTQQQTWIIVLNSVRTIIQRFRLPSIEPGPRRRLRDVTVARNLPFPSQRYGRT